MPTSPRQVEILLVEDNPGDVELTQEAFLSANISSRMHVARDGEEALDFLHARNNFSSNAVRPDLILLDLNMPKKDGCEVLAAIKEDDVLKDIPTIILTSSDAQQDIARCYKLHANAYIVKPSDLLQFIEAVEVVKNFWLCIVKLPCHKPMS